MDALPVRMSVYHLHAWYLHSSEIGSSRIEGTNACETLYGEWESNLDPLEKQLVLLITESSLQPPTSFSPVPCHSHLGEQGCSKIFPNWYLPENVGIA